MIGLIIQIVTGAIGGNVADMFLSLGADTGVITNTIAGVVGGGLGGALLGSIGLGKSQGNFDPTNLGALIMNIASSFVGGGVLLAIVQIVAPMLGLSGLVGN